MGPRAALAEMYLVLARAFLVPREADFANALVWDLPEDLDELAAQMPFDCSGAAVSFGESVGGVGAGELLQAYSALFLQPPRRASLEASVHLDGAAMGPTSLAVEACYARQGLRPAPELLELPDHISRLLEFAGWLFGRAGRCADAAEGDALEAEAREFVANFVRPWAPALAVEIRAACDELALPRPYQHLAELVAILAWEGEGWRGVHSGVHAAPAPRQARCARCETPYAEAAAVRAVRRIMQRRELPVAHLELCEDCRGLTEEAPGAPEPAGMRMG